MVVFWSYFQDFVGAQKVKDLSKSKTILAEVFQITSRFVLARKKFGGEVHFKGKNELFVFLLTKNNTTSFPGFLFQRFNNLQ